ncbi:MAG: cytidylate kinase family protein [Verrucomicrobia bacterium]|nr:cytidylate kinase family protein [Verrucomicrobiota bacterium]
MDDAVGLDRCFAFINCQLRPADRSAGRDAEARRLPAVTISRQAGCGALVVAEKLAARLQACSPKGAPPWTVFDRNLMEKVLEDHHLPARLAKFLPEDRITELQDIMDEVFGLRPPSLTIVHQVTETILHLAELGGVILIGRGGNVITARLPNVFHVRLVAPLEQRVEHAHEYYGMTKKAARDFCLREDRGRKRYLKKYFHADADDPLLQHLTINTGLVDYDEAARIIADAMRNRFEVLRR